MIATLDQRKRAVMISVVTLLLAIAASLGVAVESASAGKAEVVKEPGQVPYFGRSVLGDDDWTMVVFYRPVDCVPDTAKFAAGDIMGLIFVQVGQPGNPNAFACQPPTTSGQFQWIKGAGGPARINLKGNGDVPIWFFSTSDLTGDADGIMTFAELKALDHIKGSASSFREQTLTDVIGQSLLKVNASGELEDGRSFRASTVHHLYRDTPSTGPEKAIIKID